MPEEVELFMERNQDVAVEERRLLRKNRRDFIGSVLASIGLIAITCLCIYLAIIDFEREAFIFVGLVCFALTLFSFFCNDHYWKKYKRQRRIVRYRARVRIALSRRNEEPEAETDSESSRTDSPAESSRTDSPDPAAEGPSNLPQTESSTLSEQASIQESSEKTSSSDSTKPTSTTKHVIEHEAEAKISDISSAAEEKIANRNEEESSKPTCSSQVDSA